MRNTITIIFVLLFTSCQKEKNKVSGRLYQNCNKQPVGNTALRFYQPDAGGGDLATITTDAGGYFSFEYKAKNSSAIYVGVSNPGSGYSGFSKLPIGSDLMDIVIYKDPTCNIKVMLNVLTNTYTNRDTLFIAEFYNETIFKKIPGPFNSGQLFISPSYSILNYAYPVIYKAWYYKINSGPIVQNNLTLKACETAEAVVEIK